MEITARICGTGLLSLVTLSTAAPAQLPDALLDNLEPRAIGPAIFGGRVTDFAVYDEDPAIFYAGTASSGLLKTVNGGITWENVFDRQSTASIGDVAIDPGDPDVVWVGTGEANQRQSVLWGDGVYKSTDGGRSWQHTGLRETHHIGRIVVNPRNPDVVYVAAMGHLWGPNPERGVFMTTDGGRTWRHVLAINDDTGVSDIAMDPTDPRVLYAAAYQRRRSSWGTNGGGPHSAIYKTVDGGRTWRKLTGGIPAGELGRIGFAIYRKANFVYAIIEHRNDMRARPDERTGGIFRSEDRGESWTKMSSFNHARPGYYAQINVDQNDPNRVYVLGERLNVSDDGGKTFRRDGATETTVFQRMWVNPRNSRHLMVSAGSGIWVSRDRGETWDHLNNYPMGQYYHISVDMQQPYWIYGGLRDNSTWGGPSAVRDRVGIRNQDWIQMQGRDGLHTVVDTSDHYTIYTESQRGGIIRYDKRTGERKAIQPRPVGTERQPPPGGVPLRWNWDTPVLVSPHDPRTIYIGANKVLKSSDRGHSWTAISPDLSTQTDRDTLEMMGVLGKDIAFIRYHGTIWFGTLTVLAESPIGAGMIYAGTDDGNVHVTRDDGRNWTNLTSRIPGVPNMLVVSHLTPSAFDEGTVYVAFDGHLSDDYSPYVYVSTDFGQSWKPITANLPAGSPVHAITEDPQNPNVLYVGTEFGLFVSIDRGASWTRWPTLPTVAVHEVVVHPRDNDLVLGTHGRSILIVDDISPIQQLNPAVLASSSHLFDMRPATQFIPNESTWLRGRRAFAGPNPEFGAYINYYLKSSLNGDVRITIMDGAGTVVRELTGPNQAGIHRVTWDLRTAPVGPITVGFYGNLNFTNAGPFVLPGEYRVRLSAGRQEHTKTVRVLGDPLVAISDAERKELFDALTTATEMQATADVSAAAINQLIQRLRQVAEALNESPNAPQSVKSAVENTTAHVVDLRIKLLGTGAGPGEWGWDGETAPVASLRTRIRSLKGDLIASQSLPTAIQSTQLDDYHKDLNDLVAQVNSTISTTMPSLRRQLADNNIRPSLGDPIQRIQPIRR